MCFLQVCQDAQTVKLKSYQIKGKALYQQHCSNCHQNEGQGLKELYPPVAQADYLMADISRAICITKNGITEPLVVNGKTYELAMPANEKLTNLEIAEIMTFITTVWGDYQEVIDPKQVARALESCP